MDYQIIVSRAGYLIIPTNGVNCELVPDETVVEWDGARWVVPDRENKQRVSTELRFPISQQLERSTCTV